MAMLCPIPKLIINNRSFLKHINYKHLCQRRNGWRKPGESVQRRIYGGKPVQRQHLHLKYPHTDRHSQSNDGQIGKYMEEKQQLPC